MLILRQNLSNFVSPVWKLHNPYCHIPRRLCKYVGRRSIVSEVSPAAFCRLRYTGPSEPGPPGGNILPSSKFWLEWKQTLILPKKLGFVYGPLKFSDPPKQVGNTPLHKHLPAHCLFWNLKICYKRAIFPCLFHQ